MSQIKSDMNIVDLGTHENVKKFTQLAKRKQISRLSILPLNTYKMYIKMPVFRAN